MEKEEEKLMGWWGAAATKIAVALVTAGVMALSGWMFSLYHQLTALNYKLETVETFVKQARANDN